MKISIITVVYNGAQTIADTIRSVQAQDYDDIEYIVIDGGSTDGTQDVVRSFGDAVDTFISEPDKGIYDAMNKGLRLAGGELVSILNSDDFYASPDVLRTVADTFAGNDVDAVYGDLVYVDAADPDKVVRFWRSRSMYPRFFEDGNVPPHPSLFVRRSVYEDIGLFDPSMRLAADHEFMLRLFRIHRRKGLYIPRIFVRMRLGGASNPSLLNMLRSNREIAGAWKKNGLSIPTRALILRMWLRIRQYIQRPDH